MRIERVIARAFGPFRGEALELAPGMTVVAGPNEAGKSSWHAAIRLAITGVRRGRGRATAADAAVEARHRPWDQPEQWEVEARLQLDDGRGIDISQDLAGKVACRAWDVALGRDVSDEILDGTPDASRWLGLDRDAFAATVSVSQAQVMAVADAADELQEQMQRAAATRGTDATAAEAIARLEEFRRQAVGADTVAAKGPLRTAKARLGIAEAALVEARRRHDEYLAQSEEAEIAERQVVEAQGRLARAEAALARRLADEAGERLALATELTARHPVAPAPLATRDELADDVAAALEAWANRSPAMQLEGPSAEELARDLAALPPAPDGDLRPDPTVTAAGRALDLAEEALRALGERPPVDDPAPAGIDEGRLRELALRLRPTPVPQAVPLEAELARAQATLEGTPAPMAGLLMTGAAAVGVSGIVALVAGAIIPGVALLALALGVTARTWVAGSARRAAAQRLVAADAALAPYRQAAELGAREREQAAADAAAAGLPTDPVVLEALANRVGASRHERSQAEAWDVRRTAAAERRARAAEALRSALIARGSEVTGEIRYACSAYEAACERRALQAAAADRHASLARELAARQALERSASAVADARVAAERRLRNVARAVGVDASKRPDQVVDALVEWQGRRSEAIHAGQAAIAEWERLQSLLAGGSLAELGVEADRRTARARQLAAMVGRDALGDAAPAGDLEALVARHREQAGLLQREADALAGQLAARRDTLPDVAEAEEALTAARAELRRVELLAQTIEDTLTLLRAAEDRVHRDLAPILAEAVGRWLPIVCRGDYVEASVDPADLSIKVKESRSGQWREARLLSEGTREQIYLLLRVAMAQHLASTGETAPLLLDEVTAQSDADRKRELLDVLHHLSAERQVVLFSHDDDVAAWAERTLLHPRDALVRLERPDRVKPAVELDAVTVAG